MKTEAEIRAKLSQMIHKFEHDEGKTYLACASMIQTLEWVLDVEDKYIELSRPEELLKPGTDCKSSANVS